MLSAFHGAIFAGRRNALWLSRLQGLEDRPVNPRADVFDHWTKYLLHQTIGLLWLNSKTAFHLILIYFNICHDICFIYWTEVYWFHTSNYSKFEVYYLDIFRSIWLRLSCAKKTICLTIIVLKGPHLGLGCLHRILFQVQGSEPQLFGTSFPLGLQTNWADYVALACI